MQRVKKSEIITLRVTPRVKEAIRERARAAGLTVTDYLCYSGLGKEIVRVEGLEQVLSELKAQGRNLNQLTTLANMGRVTVLKGDALAENYGKIYEQLRELLREVTRWQPSPQSKIVAVAEVLWVVCCAMSSRRRKPHGKIVDLSPDGTVPPKVSAPKCSSPRSDSIRQMADSTITSCSPLTSRMTCLHRKFTLWGWNWPSVSFQTLRCWSLPMWTQSISTITWW